LREGKQLPAIMTETCRWLLEYGMSSLQFTRIANRHDIVIGLDTLGIFRISANGVDLNELKDDINHGLKTDWDKYKGLEFFLRVSLCSNGILTFIM